MSVTEPKSFRASGAPKGAPHWSSHALDDDILSAQMEDRERLAGELHDSVGQELVALSLDLARLRGVPQFPVELQPTADRMRESLHRAHAQIRTLSFLLQPPWEGEDFEAALRNLVSGFARRAGLDAAVRIAPMPADLSDGRKLALFRVLQEALVNVHRHAQASDVAVEVVRRGGHIVLTVRDNGRGFVHPGAIQHVGVGISNMRSRLGRFGGELRVVSHSGGATLVAKLQCASERQSSERSGASVSGQPR